MIMILLVLFDAGAAFAGGAEEADNTADPLCATEGPRDSSTWARFRGPAGDSIVTSPEFDPPAHRCPPSPPGQSISVPATPLPRSSTVVSIHWGIRAATTRYGVCS
jgi:hypothetical protein